MSEEKSPKIQQGIRLTPELRAKLGLPVLSKPGVPIPANLLAPKAREIKVVPPVRQIIMAGFQRQAQQRVLSALPPPPKTKMPVGNNKELPLCSKHVIFSNRWQRPVLTIRPPGAPSILEEVRVPFKMVIAQHQSPGDFIMLSAAIRDLMQAYGKYFILGVHTISNLELWQNNPYLANLAEDPTTTWLHAEYPLISRSNSFPFHFIHGFRLDLEAKLGLPIPQGPFKGDLHLSKEEEIAPDPMIKVIGKEAPYWLIDAGTKTDFTCKQWEIARYQKVIESLPEITFVQIGAGKDKHPELKGANVINMVGKTNMRELIMLIYHCAGIITPVSVPMHLAVAVPVHPKYQRLSRPCIVIAGGREPPQWEAYTNHQFFHTCGMLPCCDNGGCWASRVMPIGDKDEKDSNRLCCRPIISTSGQIVPQCMDMITVDQIVNVVKQYVLAYDYSTAGKYQRQPFVVTQPIVDKVSEVLGKKVQPVTGASK